MFMKSAVRGSKKRSKSLSSSASSTAEQNPIDRIGAATLFTRAKKIFRKGQPAKHIYKVESGCISTYISLNDGRRLICAFYFPGDYFGLEMSNRYGISGEAIIPSLVRVIERKRLISRIAADPAVAKYMLDITGAELQRAQNHSLILRGSGDERVAKFLSEMARISRRNEIDLLMSRRDIADHLNLTIESVSRAFARLKKMSAISFSTPRRIEVRACKRIAA
jgi:CRP/FNR family nitrogen fixation transcriptional regulator